MDSVKARHLECCEGGHNATRRPCSYHELLLMAGRPWWRWEREVSFFTAFVLIPIGLLLGRLFL